MTVAVIRADARSLPLGDASVDLVVTSPPYYALRSYTDGGEHYAGQIGSEPTPAEYIAALLDCTREWVRVLKPTGSLFVNLGDKYSQRVALRRSSHQDGLFPGQPELAKNWKRDRAAGRARMPYENVIDPVSGQYVPEKSLMGLPWRYALGCIDHLGLILRAEVVWSKPNGLPESVTDRVRRSHEQWFHLVKQPRYYSAVDEVREAYNEATARRYAAGYNPRPAADAARPTVHPKLGGDTFGEDPLGKLPGSVWEVASEPLKVPESLGVDHFAAFPTEWPRRLILGWSPPGICLECGEGRRAAVDVVTVEDRKGRRQRIVDFALDSAHGPDGRGGERWRQSVRVRGYVCRCTPFHDESQADDAESVGPRRVYELDRWTPAPTRPAVVLDPCGGTGTTALVAKVLGRVGVTVDRSADYCRLATWRTSDPGEIARAMRVPKPPAPLDGQLRLFDGAA